MNNISDNIKRYLKSLEHAQLKELAEKIELTIHEKNSVEEIRYHLLNYMIEGYIEYRDNLIEDSKSFFIKIQNKELEVLEEQAKFIGFKDELMVNLKLCGGLYMFMCRYSQNENLSKKLIELKWPKKYQTAFLDINEIEGLIYLVITKGYIIKLKILLQCIDLAYRERVVHIFCREVCIFPKIFFNHRKNAAEIDKYLLRLSRPTQKKQPEIFEWDEDLILGLAPKLLDYSKSEIMMIAKNQMRFISLLIFPRKSEKDAEKSFHSYINRLRSGRHGHNLAAELNKLFKRYLDDIPNNVKHLEELKELFFFIFENNKQGLQQPDTFESNIDGYYDDKYSKYYRQRIKRLLTEKKINKKSEKPT